LLQARYGVGYTMTLTKAQTGGKQPAQLASPTATAAGVNVFRCSIAGLAAVVERVHRRVLIAWFPESVLRAVCCSIAESPAAAAPVAVAASSSLREVVTRFVPQAELLRSVFNLRLLRSLSCAGAASALRC
jgi:hypothetical protein